MNIPDKVPVCLKHTLKDLRVRKGFSQHDAAKMMGVTEPTLHRWENDSSGLTMQQVWKFSKIYSIPQEYIFFGSNDDFVEKLDEQKEEEE